MKSLNWVGKIWKRISNIGITDNLASGDAKRIRLTNRIAIFAAILSIPHIFNYFDLGSDLAAYIQIGTVFTFCSAGYWNHLGKYQLARFSLLVPANLNVLITSSTFGFESGEHLAFIAILLLTFMVFDLKQFISIGFIIGLNILSLVFLEYTDYGLNAIPSINKAAQHETYLGNFAATYIIAIFIALYFQGLSNTQVGEIIFRAKRELQSVFDNSFDAIFLVNQESYDIIECNQRALELFEFQEKSDLIGINAQKLRLKEITAEEKESIGQSQRLTMEHEYISQQGKTFWGSVAYTRIMYDEQIQLLIRITDISDKKAYERSLIEEKEKAEAANIAKTNFLANMSHELRTPINGFIGIASIIKEEYSEEINLQLYADLLNESGERLLRTVGSILDISMIEAQEQDIDLSPIELNQLVLDHVRIFEQRANQKGITLNFESERDTFIVQGESVMIGKILDNILDNAIKFTSEGGVQVQLYQQYRNGYSQVCLAVKDTGIGMSKEFMENKLFMKFEQESEGLDRNYEGAGLGLSISKRMAETMNGNILVESKKGEGTCFTLCLPMFVIDEKTVIKARRNQ